MAYVKQTWSCGDEISAEKLNHMEDGIFSANSGGGTALVVKFQEDGITLDHTWQEIFDAFPNVAFDSSDEGSMHRNLVADVLGYGDNYQVSVAGKMYKTNSPSGYPKKDFQ